MLVLWRLWYLDLTLSNGQVQILSSTFCFILAGNLSLSQLILGNFIDFQTKFIIKVDNQIPHKRYLCFVGLCVSIFLCSSHSLMPGQHRYYLYQGISIHPEFTFYSRKWPDCGVVNIWWFCSQYWCNNVVPNGVVNISWTYSGFVANIWYNNVVPNGGSCRFWACGHRTMPSWLKSD